MIGDSDRLEYVLKNICCRSTDVLASDTETIGDADGLMQQHHHILLLHQRRQARGLSGPAMGGAGIGLQVIFFTFFALRS